MGPQSEDRPTIYKFVVSSFRDGVMAGIRLYNTIQGSAPVQVYIEHLVFDPKSEGKGSRSREMVAIFHDSEVEFQLGKLYHYISTNYWIEQTIQIDRQL